MGVISGHSIFLGNRMEVPKSHSIAFRLGALLAPHLNFVLKCRATCFCVRTNSGTFPRFSGTRIIIYSGKKTGTVTKSGTVGTSELCTIHCVIFSGYHNVITVCGRYTYAAAPRKKVQAWVNSRAGRFSRLKGPALITLVLRTLSLFRVGCFTCPLQ